jgi:hypothetical protein
MPMSQCATAATAQVVKTTQPNASSVQHQNRGIARSFAPKESKFAVLAQDPELVSG